jgi:hypothetical protein
VSEPIKMPVMILTTKKATARPIAATATIPAPAPPIMAPVLTPESGLEVDEARAAADEMSAVV